MGDFSPFAAVNEVEVSGFVLVVGLKVQTA
jgi:hypothetical protein